MNVASKELCQELYELSGWAWDSQKFYVEKAYCTEFEQPVERYKLLSEQFVCPAYDLGYLLRKLEATPTNDPDIQDQPAVIIEHSGVVKPEYKWEAKLFNGDWYEASSKTPEDAAAKLCIELFKQGVLSKEPTDE